LTQEQLLARLLVVALHHMGGHMEVTEQLLDNMGHYNIVWDHTEPVRDQVSIHTASLRSGELLIGRVDINEVTVVL
jgi:hypothetical protein